MDIWLCDWICLEGSAYEKWEVGNGPEDSPIWLTKSRYWKPPLCSAILSSHIGYCQWSYVPYTHFKESKILAVQVHDNNHKHFSKNKQKSNLYDKHDIDCQSELWIFKSNNIIIPQL